MTKTNKMTILISLLAVVAILLVVVVGISTNWGRVEEEEEKAPSAYRSNFEIARLDDTTTMSYQIRGNEVLNFRRYDGRWYSTDVVDFPLDQTYLTKMQVTSERLNGVRTVEGGYERLADFGLDDPYLTVTIDNDAGEGYTYYVSDMNVSTAMYYLVLEGDETVYVVNGSTPQSFEDYPTLDSLLKQDELPELVVSDIKRFVFKAADNSELEFLRYDKNLHESYTDQHIWWFRQDGGEWQAASNDATGEQLYYLVNLGLMNCVDYHATEEELVSYGLTEDSSFFAVEYDYYYVENQEFTEANYERFSRTEEYRLWIGNEDGEGASYVRLEGSDKVYRMASLLTMDYSAPQVEKFYDTDLCLLNKSDIKHAVVTAPDGRTWNINVDEMVVSTHGAQSDTKIEYYYTDDEGNELDAEIMDAFFDDLFKMRREGVAKSHITENELLRVEIERYSDYGDVTLVFYEHDGKLNTRVAFNEDDDILVTYYAVDLLMDYLQKV